MKIYNLFFSFKKYLLLSFFIVGFCPFNVHGESPCLKPFSDKNDKELDTKIVALSPDSAIYLTKQLREKLSKRNDTNVFLTPEREKELVIKYQETGDQAAFEELLLSLIYYMRQNTGRVGHRWNRPDFIDDLLQETVLALMSGLKTYDPNRGNRLASYVFKNFRPTLNAYMRSTVPLIKTPRTEQLPFFVSVNEPILDKKEGEHRDTLQDRLVDEKAMAIDDQVSQREKTHTIREGS